MIVLREGERFHTVQPGIESWHCFSAGAHYDPANVAFGPLIGFDEHLVAPGAGFARHAHRGVAIVSWVLAGTLRHEGSDGQLELMQPGRAHVQRTGGGIEHTETNASATEPVRFLQMTLLDDAEEPSYQSTHPPVRLADAHLSVHRAGVLELADPSHLFVARGRYELAGRRLIEGDSARVTAAATVRGAGELLVWTFSAPPG